MKFEVVKDGKKYGIYGYQCQCIIVYGNKKSLQKICDRLNERGYYNERF